MTTDIDRGSLDVSGAHEPSYYEIALTNRQVVVAFVILLTCVVAAFFSGVWIGRESSVRAQERLALLARAHAGRTGDRVDAMGNPIADKDKPEGQALQEFKFFADSRHRPGADSSGTPSAAGAGSAAPPDAGAAPGAPETSPSPANAGAGRRDQAAAPAAAASRGAVSSEGGVSGAAGAGRSAAGARSARTTAAAPGDDSSAGEGEPLPGSPTSGGKRAGTGAGSPTAVTKSAAGSSGGSGASGKTSGASRPAASSSPSFGSGAGATGAADSGAGTSSGGAAAASGDLVIQVFSTADREQADRVRDSLSGAGFAAFLSPIAKGAQTMYRVRIGPFASRADAEAVAEKVRKEHKLDTWITPK